MPLGFLLKIEQVLVPSILALTAAGCNLEITYPKPGPVHVADARSETMTFSDQTIAQNVNGVLISLDIPYLWRDWQPIVRKPGPDGGSPLYAKFDLKLTNISQNTLRVSWTATLKPGDGHLYLLQLTAQGNDAGESITLGSLATTHLTLRTHNGPYLAAGSETIVAISFKVNGNRPVTIQTLPLVVHQTM